jgi:hypothetical protein
VLNDGVDSCLIWRNWLIHSHRYQSTFLEKLICTSEGHSASSSCVPRRNDASK